MKSRGVILVKKLFVITLRTQTNTAQKESYDSKHGKKKVPSKKISSKKTKCWYCDAGSEDAGKDMILSVICDLYVHEECV